MSGRKFCHAVMLVVLVSVSVLVVSADPASAGTHGRPYQPPVVAPVVDPFRAPTNPYGAGNRGIEYATAPGTPIEAAGDGVVVFAGSIAGSLYVTVLHPDGIRTSYSFLAAISVQLGQRVAQGDGVGFSGPMFHVGARIGSTYIDPALLWDGPPHVALVPLDGGPQPSMNIARSGPWRAF